MRISLIVAYGMALINFSIDISIRNKNAGTKILHNKLLRETIKNLILRSFDIDGNVLHSCFLVRMIINGPPVFNRPTTGKLRLMKSAHIYTHKHTDTYINNLYVIQINILCEIQHKFHQK